MKFRSDIPWWHGARGAQAQHHQRAPGLRERRRPRAAHVEAARREVARVAAQEGEDAAGEEGREEVAGTSSGFVVDKAKKR